MKKTVRLIVTEACSRKCSYCCNNLSTEFACAKRVNIEQFSAVGYDELVISGGEPMLVPTLVETIVRKYRLPTYLYSALYTRECKRMLNNRLFTGISYTLHEKFGLNDRYRFYRLQKDIQEMPWVSARLKIHPSVSHMNLGIVEKIWSRIDRRPFNDESCPLPENEQLFILTQ